MKEKILVALKTKYSNLGFGAKALDGVASILEKSVTDESQIETAVSGVEPFLKVFQSDADRARTEYNALKDCMTNSRQRVRHLLQMGAGRAKKTNPTMRNLRGSKPTRSNRRSVTTPSKRRAIL